MLKNLLKSDGFNRLVNMRDGHFLYNHNDQYMGKAIEKYGESNHNESALYMQILNKGDVVIEVGANMGTHTLVLANETGPTGMVYAF